MLSFIYISKIFSISMTLVVMDEKNNNDLFRLMHFKVILLCHFFSFFFFFLGVNMYSLYLCTLHLQI